MENNIQKKIETIEKKLKQLYEIYQTTKNDKLIDLISKLEYRLLRNLKRKYHTST